MGAVYLYTRVNDDWSQLAYVKAPSTDAGDMFGELVALSSDGQTLAIGGGYEDSAVVGVGGARSDDTSVDTGALYIDSFDW